MFKKKRSFFSRLTGGFQFNEDEFESEELEELADEESEESEEDFSWPEGEGDDAIEQTAELSIDMHEDEHNIIVQTMVSGVRPEEVHVDISRDTILIEGTRSQSSRINSDSFLVQELYWGKFSRLLTLPAEVEPDHAKATEKNGLLTITIPKIDKNKQNKISVKSL